MKLMNMVCVSNFSEKSELIIGNTYEVFEHSNPDVFWVKIPYFSFINCKPLDNKPENYRTIQCYKSDFITQSENRDVKINEILK